MVRGRCESGFFCDGWGILIDYKYRFFFSERGFLVLKLEYNYFFIYIYL